MKSAPFAQFPQFDLSNNPFFAVSATVARAYSDLVQHNIEQGTAVANRIAALPADQSWSKAVADELVAFQDDAALRLVAVQKDVTALVARHLAAGSKSL